MIGQHLAREIHEQPAVLAGLLTAERAHVERLAARLRSRDIAFITIAGRGTSDNAARYAQYLFGALNQLPVALATPSLVTLYGAAVDQRRSLTIGVSQSGASPDIVAVLAEARRQGAATLAITNQPGSPLGQAAEFVLELHAGHEQSLAATKTYSAQVLALAMLSAALSGDQARWDDLASVPQAVEATLALDGAIAQRAERYRYADRIVTIGRGFCYGTAFEVALKLKETSYLLAEAHSPADFMHGPVAVVEEGFPVMLIAPSGRTYDNMLELARGLHQRGAELIAVSDRDEMLELARTPLPLPHAERAPTLPEWLAPLAAIVPGQLLALHLARAKGIDPDAPRGLNKVTLTR